MAQDRPLNRTDLVTGIVVIAIGAAAAWTASDYGIGSARRMGAGYFPLALGLIAMALGVLMAAGAVLQPGPGEDLRIDPRQFLFVTAAFVIFALGIDRLGTPLTVFAAASLACLGDRRATWREAVVLGLCLAAAIWLIFVAMLGLALPVWPSLPGAV